MKVSKNKAGLHIRWLTLRSYISLLGKNAWCSDLFEMSDAWGDMVQASEISVKTATIVCYDRKITFDKL